MRLLIFWAHLCDVIKPKNTPKDMKGLNVFNSFALSNNETSEVKGGTFCSGRSYTPRYSCAPSTQTYNKPSYSGCNFSFGFSFSFNGCDSKPKTCNPPVTPEPPVVIND